MWVVFKGLTLANFFIIINGGGGIHLSRECLSLGLQALEMKEGNISFMWAGTVSCSLWYA